MKTTIGEVQRDERDTRLHGHRLILARALWGIVAVFELAAFVYAISGAVSQLQVLCTSTSSCANLQLSAAAVKTLQHIGLSQGDYILFYLAVIIISTMLCYTIAALLLWHRSDDRMALLVSLMLMSFGPGTLSNGVRFSQWFEPALAAHVSSLFDSINLIILVLIFYLFPTGRFVPRWTRWFIFMLIGISIYLLFFPRFNASALLNGIENILFFSILLSLIIAQVYRYRRVSTPAQRQQTKWVVYSLAVAIIPVVGLLAIFQPQPGSLLSAVDIIANALLTLIPISFGVAILRYRLYDIDILINRTLVYGTLTVLLAVVYIGSIVLLQQIFLQLTGQRQSAFVIVISTLAIAALFQPLRRRLQQMIDRRFYRRKYDAAKIVQAFSARLRSEVDLSQLREHLVVVVEETMQPTFVSLWLRPTQQNANHKPWRANPLTSSHTDE